MNNIFGRSHLATRDISGSNVVDVKIDQENIEHIIITSTDGIKLYECEGRSIVRSWVCKSWLTPSSGCLNDASGTFYCPVAGTKLLQWKAQQRELDASKSVKVVSPIHKLEPHNGMVLVVFNSGFVEEVKKVIINRKEHKPQLVPSGAAISEVRVVQDMVILAITVKDAGSYPQIYLHQFSLGCSSMDEVTVHPVARPGLTLTGLTLTTCSTVVSLWSNGELCSSTVCPAVTGHLGTLVTPPMLVRTVCEDCSDSVNCAAPARLLQLTRNTVAVLGQDPGKDGGRILVFDLDLFTCVGRRQFKLYQRALRCWRYGVWHRQETRGSAGLLLLEKQQLSVMPLQQQLCGDGAQQLCRASLQLHDDSPECDIVLKTDWCTKKSSLASKSSALPRNGLIEHVSNKLSSVATCAAPPPNSKQVTKKKRKLKRSESTEDVDAVIKRLKLSNKSDFICCEALVNYAIEHCDLSLVCRILGRYRHIPEHAIVDLMACVLAADDARFASVAEFAEEKCVLTTTSSTAVPLEGKELGVVLITDQDKKTLSLTPGGITGDVVARKQLKTCASKLELVKINNNNSNKKNNNNSSTSSKFVKKYMKVNSDSAGFLYDKCDWRRKNGLTRLTNGGSSLEDDGEEGAETEVPHEEEAASSVESSSRLRGPRFLLANLLLSLPVMDSFLCLELRRLPFRDALTLVHHLQHLLQYDLQHLRRHLQLWVESETTGVPVVPTVSGACTWLSCLSDAHYHTLLLEQQLRNAGIATQRRRRDIRRLADTLEERVNCDHLLTCLLSEDVDRSTSTATAHQRPTAGPAPTSDALYTVQRVRIVV